MSVWAYPFFRTFTFALKDSAAAIPDSEPVPQDCHRGHADRGFPLRPVTPNRTQFHGLSHPAKLLLHSMQVIVCHEAEILRPVFEILRSRPEFALHSVDINFLRAGIQRVVDTTLLVPHTEHICIEV